MTPQVERFLAECGFTPIDTESSARRVAEKAVGELARLQSRLAELEQQSSWQSGALQACAVERDDARSKLAECEKELLDYTEQTLKEERKHFSDLTVLRSLVAKKDEALKSFNADSMFGRPGDTDCQVAYHYLENSEEGAVLAMRISHMKEKAQRYQDLVYQALALTPADCAGKALVEKKELAELRRDRERLDLAGNGQFTNSSH